MKKITFTILFLACFLWLGNAFGNEWKQNFFNTALSFNYDMAVENAIESGISIEEIVVLSSELGYDNLYAAGKICVLSDEMAKNGKFGQNLNDVEDQIIRGGIDPATAAKAKTMTSSDLNSLVNSGSISIPGNVELTMNYERYYGAPEEEINDGRERVFKDNQEDQGLGFGDDPGLGGGRLVMNQFNFSFGDNITQFISPSAP
ncbi:MAG: hypothetical protein RBR08_08055 [Desulforegulaceae bacterium]|nr:hypothetical protein [Desulforegulaceae bacterium]